MANFTLAIAAVKTTYDTFLTNRATSVAALATLNALVKPTPPTEVIANSDWNTYTASLLTYEGSLATAQAAYFTATQAQRTSELAVIAAMGYGTGTTPETICLDQWVKVVGAGAGILTYTNWIGASVNSTYLTIVTAQPVQKYPLF